YLTCESVRTGVSLSAHQLLIWPSYTRTSSRCLNQASHERIQRVDIYPHINILGQVNQVATYSVMFTLFHGSELLQADVGYRMLVLRLSLTVILSMKLAAICSIDELLVC